MSDFYSNHLDNRSKRTRSTQSYQSEPGAANEELVEKKQNRQCVADIHLKTDINVVK